MTYDNETLFLVEKRDFGMCFDICMAQKVNGERFVVAPVELVKHDNTFHDPMIRTDEMGVNRLMDALWLAGVRPSKGIVEPANEKRMDEEVLWLRGVADHLMKRK
jgi:hypothetical protein